MSSAHLPKGPGYQECSKKPGSSEQHLKLKCSHEPSHFLILPCAVGPAPESESPALAHYPPPRTPDADVINLWELGPSTRSFRVP